MNAMQRCKAREALTNVGRLREMLDYDATTGGFVWKRHRVITGRWSKHAGLPAGAVARDGHRIICADGRKFYAHRLAWLFAHGKWPDNEVDHINGDPLDNRIENLRDVTKTVNMQNRRRAASHSGTGVLGVKGHKLSRNFMARIVVDGKEIRLGWYPTKEEAYEVYLDAKRKLHEGCAI